MKTKHVIDYLEHCREAFFSEGYEFYTKHGITEVEDLLDNIHQDGHKCYVSYLFKDLTKEQKKEISKAVDFRVDFNNLVAYYDIY